MAGRFLSRMSIQGFKSFANKTDLEFASGITVVVGPNGCGKSNVLDSIRWVLGEQNPRILRGQRMEDVIFAGTEKRKALGFCEVAITFDNSSGLFPAVPSSEIEVSRRAYRSGEGEYYINRSLVRLMDVESLFMDTGLGVRNYSVMEQGHMDQILLAKPVERRTPFEEAAGVHRFRVRQKEAERKLEGVQANLLRVGDILKEMLDRLEKLEAQARRAREYKEVALRLKAASGTLLHIEAAEFRARIAKLQDRAGKLASDLEQARAAETAAETALGSAREARRGADAAYDLSLEDKNRFEGLIHRQELDVVHLRRQRDESRRRVELASREVQVLRENVEELLAPEKRRQLSLNFGLRREEVLAERESALNELARLRTEVEKIESQSREAEAGAQAQLLRRESTASSLGKAQGALEEKRMRLRSLTTDLDRNRDDLSRLELEASGAEQRARESRDQSAGAAAQRTKLEEEADLVRKKAAQAEAEAEVNEARRQDISPAPGAESAPAFPRTAEDMAAVSPEPGKALLKLIDCDKEWRAALEAACGVMAWALPAAGLAEALATVGEDWQAVMSGSGRAGPPPLPDSLAPRLRSAALGRAALDRMFGRVLVVDSLDKAWNDFPEPALAVVTKEGLILTAQGYAAFGGAGGLLATLLKAYRSRRGQEAEKAARLAEAARAEALSLRQALRGLEVAAASLREKESDLREHEGRARETRAAAQAALDRARQVQENLSQERVSVEADIQKMDGDRLRLDADLHDLSTGGGDAAARLALRERVEEARSLRDRFETRAEELDRQLHQLAKDESQISEEYVAERRRDLEQGLAARSGEESRAGEDLGRNEELLRQGEDKLKESLSLRPEREGAWTLAREERDRRRGQEENQARDRETKNHERSALESRISQEEIRLVESRAQLTSLEARYQEECGVPLPETEAPPGDTEELRKELKSLRGKAAALQNVNLEALSELEEVKERVAVIQAQQKDLLKADSDLREIIREVSVKATGLFTETFTKVQAHFAEIFHRLFGGGEAKLMLLDPDRPLESGIEIVVRPPGKKSQLVTLLSGGERAMTSIALTMALFRIKPSPFCVLDELDAPLDDRNVARFLDIVREFMDRTQFVIITHNKITMELGEILYGVTMEEKGVSKLVAVRLGAGVP